VVYASLMVDDDDERRCDLCSEPIPMPGGYGSGALDDGLYCSLSCFALSRNRYIPPLDEIAELGGGTDYHGSTSD